MQAQRSVLASHQHEEEAINVDGELNALKSLAVMLSAYSPAAAWQLARHSPRSPTNQHRSQILQEGRVGTDVSRLSTPVMDEELKDGEDIEETDKKEEAPVKAKVRKLPKSAIAFDFQCVKERADEIHAKVCKEVAKNARVPGFREGKAPPEMVAQAVGMDKIKKKTIELIVDSSIKVSKITEKVQTLGEFRLPETVEGLAKRYKPGKGINFTIEVDVMPNFAPDPEKYKALSVEVEKVELDTEAYNKSLNILRKRHAEARDVPKGTPAEMGNQIVVNMKGFYGEEDGSKGEALPSVAGGENIPVPMEPGKYMPGLVEGLDGVTAGETREIKVTFPRRSSAPELAGKDAIFDVEVLKVQTMHLPEPGDDFANSVRAGMKWEEMDAKLKEGVQAEADDKFKQKTHRALETAVVNILNQDLELPDALVEDVTKERFAEMLAEMREKGKTDAELKELVSPENYERFKEISRPLTEAGIKGNFAIRSIAKLEGLDPPEAAVDEEVMAQQARALQKGEKFKDSEVRPRVVAHLERMKVFDFLESFADITVIEPKDEETRTEELLGQSPEELGKKLAKKEAALQAKKKEEEATAE